MKKFFIMLFISCNLFCADDYKSLEYEPLTDVVGSLPKPSPISNGTNHARASSEAINHGGGLVGSLLADAELPHSIPEAKPSMKHVLELIVMKKKCGCFSSFTEHDKLKVEVAHLFHLGDIRKQLEGDYRSDFYDYKFKKELSDKEYLEANAALGNDVIKLYMICGG